VINTRATGAEDAVEAIASRLAAAFHPLAIYLFGSHARGEATADSDLDFLMVVSSSDQPRYRRAQQARKALRVIPVPKDVIVLTQDEWDREGRVPVSLVNTVRREGRLLHAR
jgi:predicted nucleotidyltransferase